MSETIIAISISITSFVLTSQRRKDHSIIETRSLKNVVNFFQTIKAVFFAFSGVYLHPNHTQ